MLNVKFHDNHFGIKEFVSKPKKGSPNVFFIECCNVIEIAINNMDLMKVVIIYKSIQANLARIHIEKYISNDPYMFLATYWNQK
jgi:hypothetical protein